MNDHGNIQLRENNKFRKVVVMDTTITYCLHHHLHQHSRLHHRLHHHLHQHSRLHYRLHNIVVCIIASTNIVTYITTCTNIVICIIACINIVAYIIACTNIIAYIIICIITCIIVKKLLKKLPWLVHTWKPLWKLP